MKRLGEGEGNEGRQKQYRWQPGDSDPEQERERAQTEAETQGEWARNNTSPARIETETGTYQWNLDTREFDEIRTSGRYNNGKPIITKPTGSYVRTGSGQISSVDLD